MSFLQLCEQRLGPHDSSTSTRQIVVQDDARNTPLIA